MRIKSRARSSRPITECCVFWRKLCFRLSDIWSTNSMAWKLAKQTLMSSLAYIISNWFVLLGKSPSFRNNFINWVLKTIITKKVRVLAATGVTSADTCGMKNGASTDLSSGSVSVTQCYAKGRWIPLCRERGVAWQRTDMKWHCWKFFPSPNQPFPCFVDCKL